jgi:DNA-binding NtrC family response regulator
VRIQQLTTLLATVDRAAACEGKVLITGESGVGKDLIARRIHARSARSDSRSLPSTARSSPSRCWNPSCSAREGQFHRCVPRQAGKLQAAHRGTIFLDEVGEMSLRMQAMLLRFLENGEIQAVGSDARPSIVDVRVVAATNRNLPELISAGQFREDLLYRLRVIHIEVPPLRERRDDIRPLAMHFAEVRASLSIHSGGDGSAGAVSLAGNVRELHNVDRAGGVAGADRSD